VGADGHRRVAAGQHPHDGGQAGQRLQDRARRVGGRHDVDVVRRLPPAAQAARDLHARPRDGRAQLVAQGLGHREHPPERDAPLVRVGLRRPLEPLGDAGPGAGADAGDAAQPVVRERGRQVVDARDPQGRPQGGGPLGPDAVDPGHGREALGHPLPGLAERGDLPGLHQLDDLGLERRPDVRQLDRPALHRQLGHRLVGAAHARRAAPVGEHPVPDRPLDLQEVSEQLEALGDVGVRRQLPGHTPGV
jgi:hypothetical protein